MRRDRSQMVPQSRDSSRVVAGPVWPWYCSSVCVQSFGLQAPKCRFPVGGRGGIVRDITRSTLALFLVCGLLTACESAENAKRRHFEKGKALAAAQNYREAILEYKNAIKEDAKYGEARAALADAYMHNGQAVEAGRQYIAAAELLPGDEGAQTRAAAVLLAAGDYDRARQTAAAALKLNPKNVDAGIALAMATAGLKDLDGAVKEMQEAIAMAPADFRPQMSMGSLQAQAGHTADAEAAFTRAVAMAPDSETPHMALGYYYWSIGRAAEAEKELKAASVLSTENPVPDKLLALFFISHRRGAEAETPLLKLVNKKDSAATLQLADLYVAQGHADKARPLYTSLTSQAAMKVPAGARLAALDYVAGKTKEAHAALSDLLKDQPNNLDLLTLQTRWFMNERRLDEALTVATKAVNSAPTSAPAQYTLGLVHAARHENAPAMNAFKETLRLNPRVADAQIQLSRLSLASGKPGEALSYAEAANQQMSTPASRVTVAYALLGKGDIGRADDVVRAMEKDYPNLAATHTLKGLLLDARSDPAGAAQELDRALALDPQDILALTTRVRLDLRQKQVAEGRARLARAIAANPANSAVLVLAAKFENTAGDLAAGEKHLRRSVEVDPSNLDAYALLGRMFVSQHRLDDARVEFERLAAKQPSEPGPKTMVGVLLDMQHKYDESAKVYESVVKTTPRAGVAANNLAFNYATRGVNLDAALQLAQTAKQQMPTNWEVDDTIGFVYYKKGLPELAIPPLLLCAEKAPKDPTCHFHLGLAYAKAGNKDKATASLEKALALQPAFEGADEARATLASLRR
jgi:cellulose synthase operon protein C